MVFNPENNMYYSTSIELDEEEDRFIIDNINKSKSEYEVEIIEYLEDYSNTITNEEGTSGNVYIKNFNNEIIFSVDCNENESAIIDKVKENKDRFSKKMLTLERNEEGEIFVKNVK